MNPSLIGLARCGVTSWCLNFVELFSVNYAVTSEATCRISIRSWWISGPDECRRGEHSGMLLWVIHRLYKVAGSWMAATLLVMALLPVNVSGGAYGPIYTPMDSASSSVRSSCFWSQRLPTSSFVHQ